MAFIDRAPSRSDFLAALGGIVGGTLIGLAVALLPPDQLELVFVALGALILLILGRMPRPLTSSDTGIWRSLLVFVFLFCLYPSYIPLRLPGLPWIDPIRIAAAILLCLWIYGAFAFRYIAAVIADDLRRNRLLFFAFGSFFGAQVASLPLAVDFSQALTRFSLHLLYWLVPFFVVLGSSKSEQRVTKLLTLFVLCSALQSIMGLLEAYREQILWLDFLPPGFGADSEYLQRVLRGTFRFESYRVQSSFTVSLVYAEFLVLLLPLALHYTAEGQSAAWRVVSALTALLIVPAQAFSGSRLGVVGVILVLTLYCTLYVLRRWRSDRRGTVGAVAIIALPWIAMAGISVFIASPRVQVMVLGGEQHQASNEGRAHQWEQGIPKIASRPIVGHGVGLGAEALGYTNLGGELTIDSYYLNVLLELGVPGLIAFAGMWVWGIWTGIQVYFSSNSPVRRAAGAIACSLAAFLVIKSVLSQVDNHTIVFMMLGLLIALQRLPDQVEPPGVTMKSSPLQKPHWLRLDRRPGQAQEQRLTRLELEPK